MFATLRREILAARLKVTLDEQLTRATVTSRGRYPKFCYRCVTAGLFLDIKKGPGFPVYRGTGAFFLGGDGGI